MSWTPRSWEVYMQASSVDSNHSFLCLSYLLFYPSIHIHKLRKHGKRGKLQLSQQPVAPLRSAIGEGLQQWWVTTGQMYLTRADDGSDFHGNIGNDVDSETALRRIRTAGSISISPELFEKIYLSPQNKVAGELRKTFGNPTPL